MRSFFFLAALVASLLAASLSADAVILLPRWLSKQLRDVECADELATMEVCRGHVEVPKRNFLWPSGRPSRLTYCCRKFVGVLRGGGGTSCLCRLVRQTLLVPFTLNTSRLLSLFSVCDGSISVAAFDHYCRGLETLQNTTLAGSQRMIISGNIIVGVAPANDMFEDEMQRQRLLEG